jgi:hypothetical protein
LEREKMMMNKLETEKMMMNKLERERTCNNYGVVCHNSYIP